MEQEEKDQLKVSVEIDIEATASAVFNAWLDTSMLSRWMFGRSVRDEEIVKLENDPREGGTFSYVVRRGDQTLDHTGTYLEIRPFTRLKFTWGVGKNVEAESIVSITIQPDGNRCRLQLVHELDRKWKDYASRTKEGWAFMLGKLQTALT